jgi:peptidyl-prolyl cis-trans isomerase C
MHSIVIDHAAAGAHTAERTPSDAAPPPPVSMPPVSVNGVVIARKAIAAEVQNFPAGNPGEAWRAATCALVIRELLVQEAKRLGIVAEPRADDDGRVETAEDATLRTHVEREVRTPLADEATLRRFYDNNRRRFTTPPLYEADHILFAARRDDEAAFAAAREKATAVAAVLADAPDRFAEIARDCSDCPSGAVGGSLGQIGPGDTTPEFEAALAGLVPGVVSAPVETRYGVHLVRLARRVEGRLLPFEAVRAGIEARLEEHVGRLATSQYIALLIGRAEISGVTLEGAASPLVQ